MQTNTVLTTVKVGNHTLSAEEIAAGVPERKPFLGPDGTPADPEAVRIGLAAPGGEVYTFAYPTAGADDEGLVQQEDGQPGRFYVEWTPQPGQDGVWNWSLVGGYTPGRSASDQDAFYTKRPLFPVAGA